MNNKREPYPCGDPSISLEFNGVVIDPKLLGGMDRTVTLQVSTVDCTAAMLQMARALQGMNNAKWAERVKAVREELEQAREIERWRSDPLELMPLFSFLSPKQLLSDVLADLGILLLQISEAIED